MIYDALYDSHISIVSTYSIYGRYYSWILSCLIFGGIIVIDNLKKLEILTQIFALNIGLVSYDLLICMWIYCNMVRARRFPLQSWGHSYRRSLSDYKFYRINCFNGAACKSYSLSSRYLILTVVEQKLLSCESACAPLRLRKNYTIAVKQYYYHQR